MFEFSVVIRGYDRVAVDRIVRAAEAASSDAERVAARNQIITTAIPIVLRGYDRAQVDDALHMLSLKLSN